MEIAALGLKVEGVADIDKAATALDRFSKSGDSAEKTSGSLKKEMNAITSVLADIARSVSPLSGQVSALANSFNQQASAAARSQSAMAGVAMEANDAASAMSKEGASAHAAADGVDDLGDSSRKAAKDIDGVEKSSKRAESSVSSLASAARRAAGFLVAAFSARELQQYADSWSDMTSLVRVNIGAHEDAAEVMNRLGDIARGTYSSFQQTAQGFAQNAFTLNALGKSTQDQLNYTEALNNALVVSGAKGHTAQMVQDSLNRSMAEGSLRGQELQNVMNYGSRVAELLAKELGVNVTQLRSMAKEGKITGEVIYSALVGNMEELSKQAAIMPATIGDAFTLIRNAVLQTVGVYDQANGLSESMAENIVGIADAIRDADWSPYIDGAITATKVSLGFAAAVYAAPALLLAKAAAARVLTGSLVTATGAMGLFQRSAMLVAAAFAGWEIGTYLRNEFEIVEKAGIALMGGLHTVAVQIGGIFDVIGANIKFAMESPFDAARLSAADYLQWLSGLGATALRALGFDGLADSISSDFASLRGTAAAEHKAMIEGIKRNTAAEAAAVSDIYADMFAAVGASSEVAAKKVKDSTKGIVDTVVELTDAQKALIQSYDQMFAQYHRQITLGEEATEVEQLLYEAQYGRLKGLQPEQQKVLEGMAAELDMRAQLARAAEAGKEFDKVMVEIGGMTGNTEIDRLNEAYARRKEVIDNALATEARSQQEHAEAMIKLDSQTAAARQKILEDQASQERAATLQTMANVVSITQSQITQMQGLLQESTSIGKAFFAVSQALAAANAIVQGYQSAMAIRTAYASMASTAGYGANAILAAGEVHANVAQGMGFATAGLILGQTLSGFQSGGYTGNTGVSEVAGVVHGQEYVFDAKSTARIGVENLEAMRKGKAVAGNVVNFPSGGGGGNVLTISAPVTVEAQPGMSDADARRQGDAVSAAVQATIASTLEKETRPGGMLWQMYGAGR